MKTILIIFLLCLTQLLSANVEYQQYTQSWYADEDGDTINASSDNCPFVYNPNQDDADNDNLGNECDEDYVFPGSNDIVRDLKALVVSPYGGWFTFTSKSYDQYGWEAKVVWSTNLSDLQSVSGINSMISAGNTINRDRVYEASGLQLNRPLITEKMQPATHYYVTVIEIPWDGFNDVSLIGTILEITTLPAPNITLPASHPRIMLNSSTLSTLQSRYAIEGNDTQTPMGNWVNIINQRLNEDPTDFYNRERCPAFALMYRITGQVQYLTAANACLQTSIAYWQDNQLESNFLRWANSILAITADLLWQDLSNSDRNAVAAALIPELDYVIDHFTNSRRVEDTDEWFGHSKDALLTSALLCNATGISQIYSDRACEGFEFSKRIFFGFHDVRIKRSFGFMAGSGGFEPDGYFYGQATGRYFLESFWALHNLGFNTQAYAEFFNRKLNSGFLYATVPTRNGLMSSGDTESFVNAGNHVDTSPLGGNDQINLIKGLLQLSNETTKAAYASYYLRDVLQANSYEPTFGLFYNLLFDNNAIAAIDYKTFIGTAYLAKGFGIIQDRTSWNTDASYFNFRAGWMGVDHVHADNGHFQLFRKGRWITHEALAYGGLAAQSQGHNVLGLDNKADAGIGQFVLDQAQMANIIRSSIGSDFSYVTADLTDSYANLESDLSSMEQRPYDDVQRSLVWLKANQTNDVDTIITFDHVKDKAGVTVNEKYWHIQLDQQPTIAGKQAHLTLGDQQVDIYSVSSHANSTNNTTLTTYHPGGIAGIFADPSYNHILKINVPASSGLHMINVIRAYDVVGGSTVVPNPINSNSVVGTQIGNDIVIFAKEALRENQGVTTMSFNANTSDSSRFIITGLEKQTRYTILIDGTISDLIFENNFESSARSTNRGTLSTVIITKDMSGQLTDYAGVLVQRN